MITNEGCMKYRTGITRLPIHENSSSYGVTRCRIVISMTAESSCQRNAEVEVRLMRRSYRAAMKRGGVC